MLPLFLKSFHQHTSHIKGQITEQMAENFLHKRGYRTQCKNFRCLYGEIDIIMTHKQAMVFVEVRYRRQSDYNNALTSISQSKQHKLLLTAQHYLQNHPKSRIYQPRFDIIALQQTPHHVFLKWLQNTLQIS